MGVCVYSEDTQILPCILYTLLMLFSIYIYIYIYIYIKFLFHTITIFFK